MLSAEATRGQKTVALGAAFWLGSERKVLVNLSEHVPADHHDAFRCAMKTPCVLLRVISDHGSRGNVASVVQQDALEPHVFADPAFRKRGDIVQLTARVYHYLREQKRSVQRRLLD